MKLFITEDTRHTLTYTMDFDPEYFKAYCDKYNIPADEDSLYEYGYENYEQWNLVTDNEIDTYDTQIDWDDDVKEFLKNENND